MPDARKKNTIIDDSLFATVQKWNAKRVWRLTPVGKLGRMELKEVMEDECDAIKCENYEEKDDASPSNKACNTSSEFEPLTCEVPADGSVTNPIFATLNSIKNNFAKIMENKEKSGGASVTRKTHTASSTSSANHFGKLLDAGTGVASLSWIVQHLSYTHCAAITAANAMRQMVISGVYGMGADFPGTKIISSTASDELSKSAGAADAGISYRPEANVEILVGDWMNDAFYETRLKNQDFDTVLADYLIGAVDGFSPYTQDVVIDRMKESMRKPDFDAETGKQLAPGGRYYHIALSPVEDVTINRTLLQKAESSLSVTDFNESERIHIRKYIISEIRRARDSCILLANERPYREFPVSWTERHLQKSGFKVLQSRIFPIRHDEVHVRKQLNVARTKMNKWPTVGIKDGMKEYLDSLDAQISKFFGSGQTVEFGSDYMVEAVLEPEHFRPFVWKKCLDTGDTVASNSADGGA